MADIPKEEWPEPASERDGECPDGHECLPDGRCRDEYGEYNPLAGSPEPVDGRCNALLDHWRSRYGEKRYCTQYPQTHFQRDDWDAPLEAHFCNHHSKRANVRMRAKEALQHGLFTKTREHLYDKLEPMDKLLCHALHESLLAESTFEFAEEFEEREFDFSESNSVPEFTDADGTVTIKIPRATEHIDRSQILWCAAVDSMKMMKANAKIAADEMEVESTEHAQLTSPTDDNPSQHYKTIVEKNEHHLNLAYSRLVKDRKELLSYGGVVTGTEADEEDSSLVLEDFTTIEADPEAVDGSGMLDIEADTSDSD
jgi:hypothetical protein